MSCPCPLAIIPISHHAYLPLYLAIIYWQSYLSTIMPIDHHTYQPSCLSAIIPVNYHTHQPSYPSAIMIKIYEMFDLKHLIIWFQTNKRICVILESLSRLKIFGDILYYLSMSDRTNILMRMPEILSDILLFYHWPGMCRCRCIPGIKFVLTESVCDSNYGQYCHQQNIWICLHLSFHSNCQENNRRWSVRRICQKWWGTKYIFFSGVSGGTSSSQDTIMIC